jgi:hypothetical protein
MKDENGNKLEEGKGTMVEGGGGKGTEMEEGKGEYDGGKKRAHG